MLRSGATVWGHTERRCAAVVSRAYSFRSYHRLSTSTPVLFRQRSLSTGVSLSAKRRRDFFSSNASLRQRQDEAGVADPTPPEAQPVKSQKRKNKRSSLGKSSLRRVAVEAQRSRDGNELKKSETGESQSNTKAITAICAAEQYDIARVSHILQTKGYRLDPYGTGLYPQVVHIELSVDIPAANAAAAIPVIGDVFVFPSGTVVAWAVSEHVLSGLVSETLLPAAENPHQEHTEEEDLEYLIDPNRESSSIKGDTIVLGTKPKYHSVEGGPQSTQVSVQDREQGRNLDTVLAKIAFSSGLARSTKLAVLESLLNSYFQATKTIPQKLSKGGRLPFTRSFILQKTGQLLNIRAQLNLYSELADSLPDMFWDSRHELGLEGYYDQVGRTLDTSIRIKTLNSRMDYAQEIATILRQQLSEQHGIRLEWTIIILIMVEVGFEFWHVARENMEGRRNLSMEPPA